MNPVLRLRPGRVWLAAGGLAALAGLILTGAAMHRGPAVPPLPEGIVPGTAPFVTVFMVDGLSRDVLTAGLRDGSLPGIRACRDRGTLVSHGVGAFPSMTGYAFYPFLTGETASRSGILGLRWFDRHRAVGPFRNYVGRTNVEMDADLRTTPPLLFEDLLPQYSSAFNSYLTRGSVRQWKGGLANAMAKYRTRSRLLNAMGWLRHVHHDLAPDWRVVERQVVDAAIADLALQPRLQWITFTSPDGYHHVHGDSAGYVERLGWVDDAIGRYVTATRRLGTFTDRLFLIVSDHGMVPVTRNIDPRAPLAAAGLKTFRGDAVVLRTDALSDARDAFAPYDAVLAINGNTMAHVYLRHPTRGWTARPDTGDLRAYGPARHDLVAAVLEHPGVELVAAREDGGVRVHGPGGSALITRSAGGFRYDTAGADPLAYADDPRARRLLGGTFHSRRAWLAATAHTPYPFSPVRLAELLEEHTAGDLILTARAGYDFAPDYELVVGAYRGGHGGLRADQLTVPYVLCGPGVAAGARVPAATAEDVGATLRTLLGLPTDSARAGRPIAAAIEE